MADNTDNKAFETTPETQDQQPEKLYTEDDLQKRIQSEADKRVTFALAKQKKEYEKAAKTSVTKLDADAQAESEKDQKLAEYEEKIRQYELDKARSDLRAALTSRSLPSELADLMMIDEDPEETHRKLNSLDKAYKKAIQDEVKKRLATGTPKVGDADPSEITQAQFRKMTLAQQAELYAKNPELYKKLTTTQ